MHFLSDEDIFQILESLPGKTGCTDQEIDAAEALLGVSFPPVYRRILRASGRSFPGDAGLYPLNTLAARRAEWINAVNEEQPILADPDAVVFFDEEELQEGYFFVADGTPNPPVFLCNDHSGDDTPESTGMNLSAFLALRFRKALRIR